MAWQQPWIAPGASNLPENVAINPYQLPQHYHSMTPEQQYALQQNWQQWQTYQQQYAQWQAQYGEQVIKMFNFFYVTHGSFKITNLQYQREIQQKLGQTIVSQPQLQSVATFTAQLPPPQNAKPNPPPPPPDNSAIYSNNKPPPPPPEGLHESPLVSRQFQQHQHKKICDRIQTVPSLSKFCQPPPSHTVPTSTDNLAYELQETKTSE